MTQTLLQTAMDFLVYVAIPLLVGKVLHDILDD
jgi:hypothetical protein